jgi:hypothetical protein
MEFDI